MNNTIILRTPDVIAAEINTIKRTTAKYVLEQSIEIGRLLCEAKEAVPHGEWGHWLEENCAYSTSNANNLMRIYTEYGENDEQLSFFAENRLELYGDLNRSQAIALLALPPAERAEFVKENDVPAMSVSELEAKIREAQEKTEAAVRAELGAALKKAQADVSEQKRRADKNAADLEKMKKNPKLKKVEQELMEAKNSVETLRDVAEKAAKEAQYLKTERDALQLQLSQPVVAEITEEQRASILAEANSQMSAEMAAKDAELAKLRLAANPQVSKFSAYLDQMQIAFHSMEEIILNADPEVEEKLSRALEKVVTAMAERLYGTEI
jgi:valyl-tRNA synthetase